MDVHRTETATPALRVVAGRYLLGRELGCGGFGTVYEATDTVDGATVALKRFHDFTAEDLARFRREAAALRLLRHAGVVRLRDQGEHDGVPFLVMDLIAGRPFPGRPGRLSWVELAPLARALLEVLGAVHAAGVIHRDLKPSNILVDRSGHLTLLDFGLARGAPLGATITETGVAVGTPVYLAPEQAFGHSAEVRTDLWTVGALLYEALTGAVPHHEGQEGVVGFLVRRATQPVPSLRAAAPDLPVDVASAIDALLATRPDDRPASAAQALALITSGEPPRAHAFPELRPTLVSAALDVVVRQRRALDLTGPRGAGHTHLLDAIARAAAQDGLDVVHAVPARAPYQSLQQLIGAADPAPNATLDAVHAAACAAADDALRRGAVLLVDDWATMDAFSQRLITELGPARPVARGLSREAPDPARAHLALGPLEPADLAALFVGPDRLLHLREDAAAELHRRSRGLPGPAIGELDRWLRSGLALRDGAQVRVTRANLERLAADSHAAILAHAGAHLGHARVPTSLEASATVRRASHLRDVARLIVLAGDAASPAVVRAAWRGPRWLLEAALEELVRLGALTTLHDGTLALDGIDGDHLDWPLSDRALAHGALGDALPKDDPRRLLHLVSAGRLPDAAGAALDIATALERRGRDGRAAAVLHDALALARASGLADAALHILRKLTILALLELGDDALQQVAYELQRERCSDLPTAALGPLQRMVQAGLQLAAHGGDGVRTLLDGIDTAGDPELTAWAWSLRVRAARAAPLSDERAVVAAACAWADGVADTVVRSHRRAWEGRLAYREGNWDAAADAHGEAGAEAAAHPSMRLSAATNAASALMEAGRFDEASRVAAAAMATAAAQRQAHFELRASWLARAVAYRRGDALAADPELAALAPLVGVPFLEVLVHCTEAAVGLRRGEYEAMGYHAERCRELAAPLQMHGAWAIGEALAWAASPAAVPEADARAAFGRVVGLAHAGLRLELLALLALGARRWEPAWDATAEEANESVAREDRERRLDVLSPAESWATIEAARAGRWESLPPALAPLGPQRVRPALAVTRIERPS